MIPASFPESNAYLGAPPSMEEDCDALSIQRGALVVGETAYPIVQSCWKLTPEELESVNKTGRVWLCVVGVTMPPVIMSGQRIELIPIE